MEMVGVGHVSGVPGLLAESSQKPLGPCPLIGHWGGTECLQFAFNKI